MRRVREMNDHAGAVLEYSWGPERMRLESWGEDAIRVRVSQGYIAEGAPNALLELRPGTSAGVTGDGVGLVNGKLKAEVRSCATALASLCQMCRPCGGFVANASLRNCVVRG
jgi:hypothetical protein